MKIHRYVLFIFFNYSVNVWANSDSIWVLINNSTSLEQAEHYLSLARYFIERDNDSAIYYAGKSLYFAKYNNNAYLESRSYLCIAEAYQHQFKLKESVEYYWKAIEIAEKINDKSALGSAHNGLGIVYFYLDDMIKAEHYIKKAAELKLEAKEYTYYSIILTNLAAFYFNKQQYKQAIQILKSTERVLTRNKQEKYLASLYNSLGANYQMLDRKLDSAHYYYVKSLNIALEYEIPNNIISAYYNLSDLNIIRKNYLKAIEYLKKAEKVSLETGNEKYTLVIYSTLSRVYDSIADYKNAYTYKNLQYELSNKLFTRDKQKAIEELDIKYQTAKKEKEIQQHKEQAQMIMLQKEKEKSNFIIILFFIIILLLFAVFIAYYFWQRKNANQLLEKEKSKLFENIVHEIRTPLTLIHGPLQLIKKEISTNSQLNEHIHLIENNSDKLLKLVNELLDASKLQKGKYQLAFQNGDIKLFIEDIIINFEKEAQQKNIKLHFSATDNNKFYSYPANAVEKIVFNLISNAIKYSPPDTSVLIHLALSDNLMTLSVKDNGQGIPQREQQFIFDRFYRLKIHQDIPGTGIGLSLVKELLELVKGNITLESYLNKGTLFTVQIPVQKIAFVDEEIVIDELKPCLLIVEDDKDIIHLVSSIFKTDYNIIYARDGRDGILKINKYLPDIILTDIMMPVKNGIELLQDVKSNELTNHIPIVVFSAKSSLESRLEGLKHGADAYLPKPFHPDEMRLVIQNLIKTIKRNQEEFQKNIRSEKSFIERIRSSNEYVNKVIEFVIKNIDDANYSVNELASDMCISRSQLHRKLTGLTGFSATNFIKMIRLEKSKDLLKSNWGNVTEIAYACGFNSQSYFTKCFTEYYGESPSNYL